MQDFLGALDNLRRQARQSRHLYPIGAVRTARHDLAQKDDLVALFLHRHPQVLRALLEFRKLVEMMIVGGEQRLCADLPDYVFRHCPRQRHAVIGGRPTPQLIKDDEAAVGGILEDIGRLGHLDHERRVTGGQIITRPDAREDAVEQADAGRPRRHERPHLCHQRYQRHLPQVRGLPRHIRPRHYLQPVAFTIQMRIVGNEKLTDERALDDRMTPISYLKLGGFIYLRPVVSVLDCGLGEGGNHVQFGDGPRAEHYPVALLRHLLPQRHEELVLELLRALISTEDFRFLLLQLRRNEPLGIHQRLFPLIVIRHQFQIGLAHLDVVAEDLVEADLQRFDAGARALRILQRSYPLTPV